MSIRGTVGGECAQYVLAGNSNKRLPARLFSSAGGPGEGELQDFLLADIGEGISECEVLQWFVKPGDKVEEFDKVCEVQSDKATTDITSRYEGVVHEIKYAVGDMAIVGTPLLTLLTDASSAPPPTPSASGSTAASAAPATSAASAAPVGAPAATGARVKCSPAVRRMAKENGIDLANVPPTGPDGRVLKGDVLVYIENPTSTPATPATPAATATPATPVAPTQSSPSPLTRHSSEPLADQVIPVTGIARIMAKTMVEAHKVPTLLYGDEIIMDNLLEYRMRIKAQAEALGVRVSPLAFIIKATSMALSEYPSLNSHVNKDCTEITHKGSHNIGIAMDTPRGLLVPNIKNVQNCSVLDIARDIDRLRELGLAGKLGAADLQGGTFTLSNIGAIGGTYCAPLLVVPEVCIGALGKTQVLPRYDANMELKPTSVMAMSLSADHRVLDGATVARFANHLKELVEDPLAAFLLHSR